jgi:beta-phosphoglucomutase-like phosphatase (HAD superfamily)
MANLGNCPPKAEVTSSNLVGRAKNCMAYTLVIFDLDGTLADSFSWFLTVINGVAREYGFRQIVDNEVEPFRRTGSREILRRLEVPLWQLPAITRRLRALKREQLDAVSLFPGAPAMLHALRDAGMTLSLVSSDNEDNARRQLGKSAAVFSHSHAAHRSSARPRNSRPSCAVLASRPLKPLRSAMKCVTSKLPVLPVLPAARRCGAIRRPMRWSQ